MSLRLTAAWLYQQMAHSAPKNSCHTKQSTSCRRMTAVGYPRSGSRTRTLQTCCGQGTFRNVASSHFFGPGNSRYPLRRRDNHLRAMLPFLYRLPLRSHCGHCRLLRIPSEGPLRPCDGTNAQPSIGHCRLESCHDRAIDCVSLSNCFIITPSLCEGEGVTCDLTTHCELGRQTPDSTRVKHSV